MSLLSASAPEFVPGGLSADAPEFVPGGLSADAPEFVPRGGVGLMERVYTPLVNPSLKALEFPFRYINDMSKTFTVDEITRGFVDEEPCDAGDFPKNIAEYYWIHGGKRDEETWHLLCRLKNGCYAYYRASCDYSGFDCQGMMRLFVSRSAQRIFEEAMSASVRRYCMLEKLEGKRVRDTDKCFREWKKFFLPGF